MSQSVNEPMTDLARTLTKKSWGIYAALLFTLLALLVLSPAEATLGNVVKIVYAHGAAQRIATYAYIIAGGLGVAHLVLSWRAAKRRSNLSNDNAGIASSRSFDCATHLPWRAVPGKNVAPLRTLLAMTVARWTQAVAETAIVFWLIQFVISAPAQILAWGALTLDEPRVASALWILAFTALVYVVARWIGEVSWLSLAAIVNTAILFIVLRGAINILHPIDPIIASDSPAIKGFYAAIVVTMGLLAFQFARDRVGQISNLSHK